MTVYFITPLSKTMTNNATIYRGSEAYVANALLSMSKWCVGQEFTTVGGLLTLLHQLSAELFG